MIEMSGFFASFYKNAKQNSVIIMDNEGNILLINAAFTSAFGYKNKELKGKNFKLLFTADDRKINKPEREIKTTLAEGSSSDNNFLVHQDGTPIWVSGESVMVQNINKEKYLVKVIHNIHAQKQLERFLLESNEFIDSVFESIKDVALILLDHSIKIIKANKAFLKMFNVKKMPEEGSKLSSFEHAFWDHDNLKKAIRNAIVTQQSLKDKVFKFDAGNKQEKLFSITSKMIESEEKDKRILLIVKNITPRTRKK